MLRLRGCTRKFLGDNLCVEMVWQMWQCNWVCTVAVAVIVQTLTVGGVLFDEIVRPLGVLKVDFHQTMAMFHE